jgi:hypothetical protein
LSRSLVALPAPRGPRALTHTPVCNIIVL